MAERRCKTCAHWRHDSGQWGECRPPLPWWHDDMQGAKYITTRSDGRECAAWKAKADG